MQNILQEIVENKKIELKKRKALISIDKLKNSLLSLSPIRNFKDAISKEGKLNLIAEIKKSSPSAGHICMDFNPSKLAVIYEENGAAAISVLTEEKYFEGKINYLEEVRKCSSLPLLCKDFVVDEYQFYQARYYGADAILLIAGILKEEELIQFLTLGKKLGLDCLVEVHQADEIKKVLNSGAEIIGINNRNLRDFSVNIETTLELRQMIPDDKVIVSESGIKNREDVLLLQKAKINAILIGQSFLESKNPAQKMKELGLEIL
ncbi:indole-3-glycerol phosphate synthase TrpC [bacterium]|nr:indole-3-glycerol phosphate synthase TrpC [bacterium]